MPTAKIAGALRTLAETTLLFLSNIKSIGWKIGREATGEVLSVRHSEHHFEILKQTGGRTTTSSHFLKFDRPVGGKEKHKTAVAFEVDLLPNVQEFDSTIPIAKQVKIVAAAQGRVAVFFSAEKETSGLRFHLHAPFVPELSRASVKETPVNRPLFQQLATLAASALHEIRDLGLLSVDFLSVLPNPQDGVPPRYQGIRTAIIEEMNLAPLTPTHGKSYAPANILLQARASLKDLLSEMDIKFLVDHERPPQWAIGATQRNSNADRFLAGLAIREWDIKNFVQLLIKKASESTWAKPDGEFMKWFEKKPADWHQQLYALLYKELEQDGDLQRMNSVKLIRLSDGNYSLGGKCYFASEGGDQDEVLPRVDVRVYTSGKNKTVQENARHFLEKVGVRMVGEAEQVEAVLKQRYRNTDFKPAKRDLVRFVELVEKNSEQASLFAEYFIFEAKDGKWHRPDGLFLDEPFVDTGLTAYYDGIGSNANRLALAESYRNCGVGQKRLLKFAEAVGVQTRLEIASVACSSNPEWSHLRSVGGDRYTSPINRDYDISHLTELLKTSSLAISKLIWRTMCSLPQHPNYLRATYQRNQSWGAHHADSQLVHHLKLAEWVPQRNNSFARPTDASRDLLPEGFPFDPGWPWLKAIRFGEEGAKKSEEQREKQVAAKELGFADTESLERAKRFAALPPEEQERILADHEHNEAPELPEHIPSNPERRAERVGAQAADAPDRRTEQRTRSVSIAREQVKQETAQYLREQYTNSDGDMICQVCKTSLPFKLDDGSDYFEKVEFLVQLKKFHYQNYLALCPNHAAMFKHANGSADSMLTVFIDFAGNELEVVLAQKDNGIYFTKTHVADLRAVIEEESNDSESDGAGEELEETLSR